MSKGFMNRLLAAYLARLKKNGMFRGLLLLMAGTGVLVPLIAHGEMQAYGVSYSSESRLGWHTLFTGIITALFTAGFLGTEYSDGTIRNKLIAGHTRSNIYLSSLGICALAHTVFLLAHMVVISVLSQWLIAPFRMNTEKLMLFYLFSLLIGLNFTALYTMIVMLNQNKSAALTMCVLTCLMLFVGSFYIYERLAAPEMIPGGYALSADGVFVDLGMEPNPHYLQGVHRTVYEWLLNILPYGQSIKLAQMQLENSLRMILCNLCLMAGATFTGLWLFGRKDLK